MPPVKLHSCLVVFSDYRSYTRSEETSTAYLQDWERLRQDKEELRTNPEVLTRLQQEFAEKWQLKQDDALPVDLQYAFRDPWVQMPDGSYEHPSKEWREQYLNERLLYRIENGGDSHHPEFNTPTDTYIHNLLNFHFERQASNNLKDRFVRYVHNLIQVHLNERLEQAKNTNDSSISLLRVASQWDRRKTIVGKSEEKHNSKSSMPTSKQVGLLFEFLRHRGGITLDYPTTITLVAIVTGTDRETQLRFFNAPDYGHDHLMYTKRNIEWVISQLKLLGLDTIENEQWLRAKGKPEGTTSKS
ncbi:hypothetical protein MTX78_15255 [Hymenobacter tibetensis]|uniref:Uncharacterized protein n=1 Tax=Hymenobacter tibetensis TaxID=497967 RepID=A0ABY4CUQ5_9BACT|nr:hypothetical protein [Hymenobacter tibetensis]UOG73482.1 hypothetical protein MTX78_15255 [Hymenobacter tibetensis]